MAHVLIFAIFVRYEINEYAAYIWTRGPKIRSIDNVRESKAQKHALPFSPLRISCSKTNR